MKVRCRLSKNPGHAFKTHFVSSVVIMIPTSCYVHFHWIKSIIWHSLSIVYWGISKTVLEAFWTWPAGSIFTSECRTEWSPMYRQNLFWLHWHETFNAKSLFKMRQSVIWCRCILVKLHPFDLTLLAKYYTKNHQNPPLRSGQKMCGNVFPYKWRGGKPRVMVLSE